MIAACNKRGRVRQRKLKNIGQHRELSQCLSALVKLSTALLSLHHGHLLNLLLEASNAFHCIEHREWQVGKALHESRCAPLVLAADSSTRG